MVIGQVGMGRRAYSLAPGLSRLLVRGRHAAQTDPMGANGTDGSVGWIIPGRTGWQTGSSACRALFLYFAAAQRGMLEEMAHVEWPLAWIYGDLVWMTALGLALGLGIWRALHAPRRLGRRYFGRQLAQVRHEHPVQARRMVHHGDGLADGEVQMLVGRLRVAGATCESYDRGAAVAASTIECPLDERGRQCHGQVSLALRRRADRLALELDGGASVALEGEVEVLVGSRQAHPRRRLHGLPRLLCERVYRDRPAHVDPDLLLHQPPVIRNLTAGDTVIAVGQVVADGAVGPDAGAGQPYRAPAPQRWVVRPAGPETPAIAMLYAGAPAIPTSPWARFGLGPMAWVAGATAALALTGALALRLAWQGDLVALPEAKTDAQTETPDEIALALRRDRLPVDAPALAVAATSPFHRATALDLLAQALAGSRQRGRDLVEARVAIARLQGRCAAAADVLRQHRQPTRAITAAEQCIAAGGEASRDTGLETGHEAGDETDLARHVMGLAWMDLGAYWRASQAFAAIRGDAPGADWPGAGQRDSDLLSRYALAHVLADAWTEAAAVLHRLAEHGERSGSRVAYTCLAKAAAARGGDAGAREALEGLARSSRSPACTLLAADLSQGEARRAWLHDPAVAWHVHGADAGGKQMLYLRELLLREIDASDASLATGAPGALRLLGAGLPDGDTPYEAMPALEWAVLLRLHEHDAFDGDEAPTRRERAWRMAITARAAGLAAHMGRHDRAFLLRDMLVTDVEEQLAQDASDDRGGAAWHAMVGDALLLAAVTHWRAGTNYWRPGQLAQASRTLEYARTVAPAARLAQVESVLALDTRGELRPALAGVLTGGRAGRGVPGAGEDEVMAVARAGDGAALAELVADGRVTPNAIGVLAPALRTGQDALLELLRWGRDPGAATVGEFLWHEGARAFAAERLGDHALAQEVRAAAQRRYEALAHRESAVLVFLLEHL
jgi:hypothetical protein